MIGPGKRGGNNPAVNHPSLTRRKGKRRFGFAQTRKKRNSRTNDAPSQARSSWEATATSSQSMDFALRIRNIFVCVVFNNQGLGGGRPILPTLTYEEQASLTGELRLTLGLGS